jgi:acetyl-CoA acetyltransferase
MTEPIAILSYVAAPTVARNEDQSETQMLVPVVGEALERAGIARRDIGFTCSGSCDYLTGATFTFVQMLEATAAWPPIAESHVEADGAWALYEAWVRLQHGDIDSALVYASGKSSMGNREEVMGMQLDPYYLAPLWLNYSAMGALQASAVVAAGKATERDFAEIAARSFADGAGNPHSLVPGGRSADELLAEPYVCAPLRAHDVSPVSDGAAAMVIATASKVRELGVARPVWIKGFDHRVDPHYLGNRDLAVSRSMEIAAQKAAAQAGFGPSDCQIAELAVQFTPEEVVLKDALGLGAGASTAISPSGGGLVSNPIMVTGMARIGAAADAVADGRAARALGHASSGPCLQQNLVVLLEGGE